MNNLGDVFQSEESKKIMYEYNRLKEENKDDIVNPSYHFWTAGGKINDPNGLCFWNGKYHIFYQQLPFHSDRWQWGHAFSEDMVRWQELPPAICPDREKDCFSGNTLVEDDKVIAMYYGVGLGNMIAISNDSLLLDWKKLPSNPVIPSLEENKIHPFVWKGGERYYARLGSGLPYRIHDPFIWKEDEGYYALSGTHANGKMQEHVFFSQNLDKWTYIGILIDDNPYVERLNDGACPYFLPFGNNDEQRILFFFSHGSGSRALIGKYDKIIHKFYPMKEIKFSFDSVAVSSLIAPCAISDGKGGVYVTYNVGDRMLNGVRRGCLTLTRYMTCDDEGNIIVKPADQVNVLRESILSEESFTLNASGKKDVSARGKCIEINAQIDMTRVRSVEFYVLCNDSGQEYTKIIVTKGSNRGTACGYVTVDTSHSSLYENVIGRIPDSTRFLWDGKEKVSIRIFVDKCIVEVFVNDQAALCQFAYASLPESDKIKVEVLGGEAVFESLKVYSMFSII